MVGLCMCVYYYNHRAMHLTFGQRLTIVYKACKTQNPKTREGAFKVYKIIWLQMCWLLEKCGMEEITIYTV